MLAVFQVYLPFTLFVPANAESVFPIQQVTLGNTEIQVAPPYTCGIKPEFVSYLNELSMIEVNDLLDPVDDDAASAIQPLLNDHPARACNALQITFHRDTFDRNSDSRDPSTQLAFSLANDWLLRLRTLGRAAHLRPISEKTTVWRITYLNDDGSPLEPNPPLLRRISGGASKLESVAISEALWGAVGALSWGYKPRGDDSLLLDAARMTPEVGPALVLAFTALETHIAHALERVAELYGVPHHLWKWVNDRGDFIKEPSIGEQFDTLLKAITGQSLKEDARLWEAFRNLRSARNSFVHQGQGVVGQDVVDEARASTLISAAEEIIDWVDRLLPDIERRPKFDTSSVRLTTTKLILKPTQDGALKSSNPDDRNTE